jgi:hypothetical protein
VQSPPPLTTPYGKKALRGRLQVARHGLVSEAIGVVKGGITYGYLVTGKPGRDYKVGSKIRSATVTGAGGISGKASYSATKGRPRLSTGSLSGSLAVTMAAIGRVTPLAGSPRDAIQRLFGAV